MGNNILLNPTLTGFSKPPRAFTDKSGNLGYMENPDNWEYIWTPAHDDDPNRVPQSLHRDKGYCIAAGWRRFEAGYVQRGVQLRRGQRYLAKAVFQPDVNFPNSPVDVTAVQWRFWIEGGGEQLSTNWQTTAKGQYKQPEEHLFLIEASRDVTVDFYFKVRSIWENNVCDFNLHGLTLEEVPSDYGANPAPIGGSAQPSGFQPVGQREATFASTTSGGASPAELMEMMSDDDLTVIANGFRAAATSGMFSEAINQGFARFADVLERYQDSKLVG